MKKILIVEDEKPLAEMLNIALSEEGYMVNTAYSGEEAESIMANSPFDVILLDLLLPGKDGLTVCRDFREKNTTTPIIMLTGKATEADIIKGLDSGADDYVVKPFRLGELCARMRSVSRRASVYQSEL
jgi:two-component system, OmpR family, copper resistance phosphate regulon response regulator CusR